MWLCGGGGYTPGVQPGSLEYHCLQSTVIIPRSDKHGGPGQEAPQSSQSRH